jgi:hypothetical protein
MSKNVAYSGSYLISSIRTRRKSKKKKLLEFDADRCNVDEKMDLLRSVRVAYICRGDQLTEKTIKKKGRK